MWAWGEPKCFQVQTEAFHCRQQAVQVTAGVDYGSLHRLVAPHRTMEQFRAKAVTGTVSYCSVAGPAGLERPALCPSQR